MEDETTSVSKGVFIFKNKISFPKKRQKKSKTKVHPENYNVNYASDLWYQTYLNLWNQMEADIEDLNENMFHTVLDNLINYIKTSHNEETEFIPTAALLTGVNMPDHAAQFSSLKNQIKRIASPHVTCLYSQDCQNLKNLIENMMDQFINQDHSSENEDDLDEGKQCRMKKNQMNISTLQCWYDNLYTETIMQSPKKPKTKQFPKNLVVIFPEFESLNLDVLQKFLLIVSERIPQLPFVLVFGIATSTNTLTNSLPYKVISRMMIKVFHSQSSSKYLDSIVDNVFLNYQPFHLGGQVFDLFMDIFLFYDLSVNTFIQNMKFAMMEHFCHGNAMALCNLEKRKTNALITHFSQGDLENVRKISSFKKLVESDPENSTKLLTDDEYFRGILSGKIIDIQKYLRRFHIFLECLLVLVSDLPKAPLGEKLRQLYSLAVSKNITKTLEYKECFQLLNFQSKDELSVKLQKVQNILSKYIKSTGTKTTMRDILDKIKKYVDDLTNFDMQDLTSAVNEIEEESDTLQNASSRNQFRQQLKALSKQQNKSLNKYEKLRQVIVDDLSKIFEEFLIEPSAFPFYEIFFFDDISIQQYIVGTHRAAIHNALNDPHYYLQCKCCVIPNLTAIKPFMPDICIAYKLHLECGKLINLYDWLQAFLSIVDPNEYDEEDKSKRIVEPQLQARFTQAVAELELLGFIKSSKRKSDHVTRLTWGG